MSCWRKGVAQLATANARVAKGANPRASEIGSIVVCLPMERLFADLKRSRSCEDDVWDGVCEQGAPVGLLLKLLVSRLEYLSLSQSRVAGSPKFSANSAPRVYMGPQNAYVKTHFYFRMVGISAGLTAPFPNIYLT